MLRRFLALLLAIALQPVAFAQSNDGALSPYVLVQEVAQKTFERMSRDRELIASDADQLRSVIRDELIPHVDYKFAAFKVLGKNFKTVPKDKLEEYVEVFREYLIATYASTLSFYDQQVVEFEPKKDTGTKTFAVVRATIKGTDGPDINLAFKVRKHRRTNQWKAFDIVAEGISLVDSKRSEFGRIIRQGGIDLVLAKMQKAIARTTLPEAGSTIAVTG